MSTISCYNGTRLYIIHLKKSSHDLCCVLLWFGTCGCINKLTINGSDNGLSPDRRQAIIWTNAGILLIGPLGTNFSEIFIGIHKFSFKKMHLKMSSGKCWPFCPSLNVLRLLHCHWLCRMNGALSSMRNDFYYLHHISIGKWQKLQIHIYVFSKKSRTIFRLFS